MTAVTPGPAISRGRALVYALVGAVALAAILALTAIVSPAQAEAKKKSAQVKVMTRNLFLGADLTPAIEAESVCAAIDAGGVIMNEVDDTDFPARAKLLAEEIADAKPHLVGLQEVALWRDQVPSDFTETPAEHVRYDFLKILQKQLKKRDANYKVAVIQEEFDQELPANTDGNPDTGGLCGADLDGRLTMRDAILVKKGKKVKVTNPDMGHFENLYEVDLAGLIPIDVERGWVSVDAKLKSSKKRKSARFHFVNTHLEAFGDPEIREAQARELFEKGGPLRTKKQLIFLGDINSGGRKDKIGAPFTDPEDPLAYNALTKDFGLKNRGARQTCCYPTLFADDLDGYELDHTVDHVMVKPKIRQRNAFVTGADTSVTTPGGLLSSDHGGLVSKLKLR